LSCNINKKFGAFLDPLLAALGGFRLFSSGFSWFW